MDDGVIGPVGAAVVNDWVSLGSRCIVVGTMVCSTFMRVIAH